MGKYKVQFYEENEDYIFEELTVSLLELFRFGKGKEVEGHIQWFMGVLEKKLDKIPTENNGDFISSFSELYFRVGYLLKGTQSKF